MSLPTQPLPPALQTLLDQALADVRTDDYHTFRLVLRRAIYQALGPERPSGEAAVKGDYSGYYRRCGLAMLAAHHVLSRWQPVPTGDRRQLARRQAANPQEMLELAGQGLLDPSLTGPLQRYYDMGWTACEDLGSEEDNGTAGAAFSAVAALGQVVFDGNKDEEEDPEFLDPDANYDSSDPWHEDANFFAQMASANGASADPNFDPAKSLEYWEWWLTEAVPQAHAAVGPDGKLTDAWYQWMASELGLQRPQLPQS